MYRGKRKKNKPKNGTKGRENPAVSLGGYNESIGKLQCGLCWGYQRIAPAAAGAYRRAADAPDGSRGSDNAKPRSGRSSASSVEPLQTKTHRLRFAVHRW